MACARRATPSNGKMKNILEGCESRCSSGTDITAGSATPPGVGNGQLSFITADLEDR